MLLWRKSTASLLSVTRIKLSFSQRAKLPQAPRRANSQSASTMPKKKRKRKRTRPRIDPFTEPPCCDTFPKWAYDERDFFRFEVVHASKKPGSLARVGRIHTPHGVVDTPSFVAVGTNGTLKAIDNQQTDESGVQLMFCNTYHLLLQPGPDIVEAGGEFSYQAGFVACIHNACPSCADCAVSCQP